MRSIQESKIAVIGLGYVGLPLAVEFAKKYEVTGFDISSERVTALKNHNDHTREVSSEELQLTKRITYTDNEEALKDIDIYIITVPTPIDEYKKPDLTPLRKASKTVGRYLKKDAIVIYESTVYPGCTEEVCVPELEEASGFVFNKDFYCGYSPERINPGDKIHRVHNIVKVTSGSTPEIAKIVDELYKSIVEAGTHKASSIKVAEASKVVENVQRDTNISLVNELALIFHKMNIDTLEVLEAASTKWNFIKFTPGLVGGHCISVDPYYLTYKAQNLGYSPEVILSGRRVNDYMTKHISERIIKLMTQKHIKIKGATALILGITFKENCSDIRNTKVVDLINNLKEYNLHIEVYDPYANYEEVLEEYGIAMLKELPDINYDVILITTPHDEFNTLTIETSESKVVFDVKGLLPIQKSDGRL